MGSEGNRQGCGARLGRQLPTRGRWACGIPRYVHPRLEWRRLLDRVAGLEARPNKDVLALLADADVFFFPSLGEGMPNSAMEAMAVGLPVVASNVGAIPEMIDVPDGGMLLDPQDVDGFAQAMIISVRTRNCGSKWADTTG